MANKFYTVKKKIGKTTYTAQFNGLAAALKAVDDTYIEGSANTSTLKFAEYLFENVIVEPKGLTVDDFESMEEFNEVTTWARKVMQGEFRDKKNKDGAGSEGKE